MAVGGGVFVAGMKGVFYRDSFSVRWSYLCSHRGIEVRARILVES